LVFIYNASNQKEATHRGKKNNIKTNSLQFVYKKLQSKLFDLLSV